jgi:hypothetical protein
MIFAIFIKLGVHPIIGQGEVDVFFVVFGDICEIKSKICKILSLHED